jgi:hypothetical protein
LADVDAGVVTPVSWPEARRRIFAAANRYTRAGRLITQSLRLAYRRDDFEATRLYARLQAWESAHAPYRIFPPP